MILFLMKINLGYSFFQLKKLFDSKQISKAINFVLLID